MTATALREQTTARGSVRELVEVCVEVLGDDLTAYLAGANSVAEFRAWCAGPVLAIDTPARRVAAAAEVIGIFHMVNRTADAGPWLREVDAWGTIPARVLRESSADSATIKALHEAAEAFTGR